MTASKDKPKSSMNIEDEIGKLEKKFMEYGGEGEVTVINEEIYVSAITLIVCAAIIAGALVLIFGR